MSRVVGVSTAAEQAGVPRKPARAETVGSLLRPPALRQAIAEVPEHPSALILPVSTN